MPYLNWKGARPEQLEQEVRVLNATGGAPGVCEFRFTLKLGQELLQELIPQLEEIYVQGGAELRVDLPSEWIMFWKSRAGESRLLMAHPQPNEWVSTMALSTAHGKKLTDTLKTLSTGETVSIEKLGPVGSMTNVEVLITHI